MKAFLLAAGYGTRLRPLTEAMPKCMVPICGRPLLGWWLDLLNRHKVSDVLINTHYLPEPVREYIAAYNRLRTGLTAHEAYEPELLGSGGTVRANRDFVRKEKNFLICYADNLTDADLGAFVRFHEVRGAVLSMALFHTNEPRQCGIAELGSESRIVRFTEKPENPKGNLANAGIYVASQGIFDFIDGQKPVSDFGKDVLPKLAGQMYGWRTEGYLVDIGTKKNYEKANREWRHDYYEDTLAH